jgi:hypothetical protein
MAVVHYSQMSWTPKPSERRADFQHTTVRTTNVSWGEYICEYLGDERWHAVFKDLEDREHTLPQQGRSRHAAYDAIREHHHCEYDKRFRA